MSQSDAPKAATRPRSRRLGLALTGILMAAVLVGAGAYLAFAGHPPPGLSIADLSIGGPFTLQAANGRTVTDRDFRGRYMLIYFGYTHCPDECPTTLAQMAVAIDKLGPVAGELRPLFITIDPHRDPPASVGRYAAQFSPGLIGLSGSQAQIDSVAHEYGVMAQRQRTGPGPDDYEMSHTSILYLMDKAGRFLAPIPASAPGTEIAADITRAIGR